MWQKHLNGVKWSAANDYSHLQHSIWYINTAVNVKRYKLGVLIELPPDVNVVKGRHTVKTLQQFYPRNNSIVWKNYAEIYFKQVSAPTRILL